MPRERSRQSSRILELIALGALILVWVVVASVWHELPAQIPRHFGLNGEPDGWGSRPTILVLPAVALLSYLTRAPRSSPGIIREFLAVLRVVVLVGIGWATIGVVRVAGGRVDGLGGWFVPCLFLSVVATGAWFGFRTKRSRSGRAT